MPQILSVSWSLVVIMMTGMFEVVRVPGQFARRLEAVHARHDDIHEDAVRTRAVVAWRIPSSPLSATSVSKPRFFEHVLEQVQLCGRVVNDKNGSHPILSGS